MNEAKKNKVLMAARDVFLRYGYKRVNMNDIAAAVDVSRPALYLLFKNKEEIFAGVIAQWIEATIADIELDIASTTNAEQKIARAFEIWAVRPFEMAMNSPEAKELVDCSFDFAQDLLRQGYTRFERAIAPILGALGGGGASNAQITPERIAHVLASAVRGFKQTAATPVELRRLIKELLTLSLTK